jgi:NADH-quinone oxidoreductase subunit L
VAGAAGVVRRVVLYMKRPDHAGAIKRVSPIYTLLDNKYYMDKINEVVFARGAVLAAACGRGRRLIDGLVNGSARWWLVRRRAASCSPVTSITTRSR